MTDLRHLKGAALVSAERRQRVAARKLRQELRLKLLQFAAVARLPFGEVQIAHLVREASSLPSRDFVDLDAIVGASAERVAPSDGTGSSRPRRLKAEVSGAQEVDGRTISTVAGRPR